MAITEQEFLALNIMPSRTMLDNASKKVRLILKHKAYINEAYTNEAYNKEEVFYNRLISGKKRRFTISSSLSIT